MAGLQPSIAMPVKSTAISSQRRADAILRQACGSNRRACRHGDMPPSIISIGSSFSRLLRSITDHFGKVGRVVKTKVKDVLHFRLHQLRRYGCPDPTHAHRGGGLEKPKSPTDKREAGQASEDRIQFDRLDQRKIEVRRKAVIYEPAEAQCSHVL